MNLPDLLWIEPTYINLGNLITKSNADNGGHLINSFIDKFTSCHENVISYNSLGQFIYYNLLNTVDCIIGNSSSGIMEAPFFKVPTINIGNRQKGRIRHKSIIDTSYKQEDITKAIKKVRSKAFLKGIKK